MVTFRSITKSLMLASLFVLGGAAAKAQAGVYLNPVATRISDSPANNTAFTFLGANTTSRIFGGFDIGGYWDFLHTDSLEAGLDVRDTFVRSNGAGLNSFIVSARVAGKPMKFGLQPYVELGGGVGRSRGQTSSIRLTKTEYGILVGADKRLSKHVDWRVIEVGYGSVTTIASSYNPVGLSVPAANLINVSAGLVFRIGGR